MNAKRSYIYIYFELASLVRIGPKNMLISFNDIGKRSNTFIKELVI